jgi:hypothetical protein
LLAARPLFALAVVWLIAAGHTMNFREMGAAHGWVPAEIYSLHNIFAVSIALTLLACRSLACHASAQHWARCGVLLLAAGSFLNGLYVHAPFPIFVVGRGLAGVGVGLTIFFAPRILDARLANPTTWASIALPVIGPGAISAATMMHETSDWESGFLVEGFAALIGFILLLTMTKAPDSPESEPSGSQAYLPFLIIGSAGLVYCLHWGQLYGWLESSDIVIPGALGGLAMAAASHLAYPQLDFVALREGWLRLLLCFFGGVCQFFHGTTMNLYGGLLLNYSTWERTLLIWWLPLGVATSLGAVHLAMDRWQKRPGVSAAIAGLLLVAAGMHHLYERTFDWPYWQVQNVADLNWFPAPQYWELAPGRFIMGLGIGLFMIAMDLKTSPDPEREKRFHPFLLVAQFYGSGLGVALLVNFFLIGQPINYSYAADRDYIQAEEFAQRRAVLRDALDQAGEQSPDRQADALLFRGTKYESDNLVFAQFYVSFTLAALGLAVLCLGLLLWDKFCAPHRAHAP